MSTADGVQLWFGRVMHERVRPLRNRFTYRVFYLRVKLGTEASIRRPLLSVDRWNLLSFYRADHGPRDGSDLLPWINDLLAREGIAGADGDIWLQTFPRVLGYVFNPVSFWLCHDRAGALRAVLCEVSNTFGERHNYLVAHASGAPIEGGQWLEAAKVFHVSPFCPLSGRYRFRFVDRAGSGSAIIDYHDERGRLLLTSISGTPAPADVPHLLRALLGYPWMTLGVIARIHYQALKLWVRGMPFIRKPAPPAQETTR